jgi:uncharacterized membrane protein
MVTISAEAHFIGPLPPPGLLKGYENVCPGSAERILAAFEKQSEHRMKLEKTVVGGDSVRAYMGIVAAFLLCALIELLAYDLVRRGFQAVGAGLGVISLGSLVGTFVYGTRARSEERKVKYSEAHAEDE